jgi:hypothetical protein
MTDPEDAVRQRHPEAEAREHPPQVHPQQAEPYTATYWAIYPAPGTDQPEIGRGRTEADAWFDAAGRFAGRKD